MSGALQATWNPQILHSDMNALRSSSSTCSTNRPSAHHAWHASVQSVVNPEDMPLVLAGQGSISPNPRYTIHHAMLCRKQIPWCPYSLNVFKLFEIFFTEITNTNASNPPPHRHFQCCSIPPRTDWSIAASGHISLC